jgi:Protein of unknown function (DUF2442)
VISVVWVLEANVLTDHRLRLRFSDGSAGTVDLGSFVFADSRPIVMELRDAAAFAALRVEFDTVVWANGFDLAPEFLHARLVREAAA